MSLTNPNKPVTEARLQEFYHRIKSYLGFTKMPSEDMSEVISPLPSVQPRYHKYSTEEHIVGEWIDGSKVYEKTVYFEALSNKSYITKPHGVSNLGEVIFLTGIASNGVARNVIPFTHDQSVVNQILLMVNGADIEIDNRGYDYSTFHAYVTIQYTKSE